MLLFAPTPFVTAQVVYASLPYGPRKGFAPVLLLAPSGTTAESVNRLAADLAAVMELPEVRERFAAQSADASAQGPEAFAQFIEAEREKWANIVKRSGAKVD